ncbi:nucleotidyltransferase family protein [Suttonella sp. R2A3]|uniref:N-acetylmuramate alpha-1-phosphate uridylyltransferase MurU n=1 Tax=Suttonella sp. R2A3 TaxID=2908648 RepID=UPI001F3609E0|nr:nucleotidyltransferase family protein [Suttonella sp. R2A3]UJF23885.1 nucleotidyltransferase family protein [Suttonella sp. R2A3]
MKVMILAAGRGKRMQALTDDQPKPLLRVGQYSLIEWQIQRLAQYGFSDLVINLGYHGEQIRTTLGDGRDHGVRIAYSREPEEGLETAGGIIQALPLLGNDTFLCVNADVWCDVDYRTFAHNDTTSDAHLLLVDNPVWKARGDFGLSGGRVIAGETLTYAGIARFNPRFFAGSAPGFRPLAPLLHQAVAQGAVSGEHHIGDWQDVGTPERLATLQSAYH